MERSNQFVCDQPNCGHVSKSAGALRKHYHDKHPERKDAQKEQHAQNAAVVCPYCGHGYGRNSKMFEHIRSKRAANDPQHQDREGIVDPLPKKDQEQVVAAGKPKLRCLQCLAEFTQSSALNRHLNKGRCPNSNSNFAVPANAANVRFGNERVAHQAERPREDGVSAFPLPGQEQALAQAASSDKPNEEEKKEENLVNQWPSLLKEDRPPGSDGLMQSLDHLQGDHHNISAVTSSLPGGLGHPEADQPLIGQNLNQTTFNNDQQDHQSADNFDIAQEVLLSNNNTSSPTVPLQPSSPSNSAGNGTYNNQRSAFRHVEGQELEEVLNKALSEDNGNSGNYHYDEAESDLSVPRFEYGCVLASETLSDKITRVETRLLAPAGGSFKSVASSSGKRKTLVVVKKPQRKKIIVCSGDNDQNVEESVAVVPSPELPVVQGSLFVPVAAQPMLLDEIQEEDVHMANEEVKEDANATKKSRKTAVKNKNKKRKANAPRSTVPHSQEEKVRKVPERPPAIVEQIYSAIKKGSELLWSQRDALSGSNLHVSQSTRQQCQLRNQEDQAAGGSLLDQSDASIGYGEITAHSMQKILCLLQRIDSEFQLGMVAARGANPVDYRLTEQSSFLDIGSGFGKAVWHAYAVANCLSVGIEIVDARHQFAIGTFDLLLRQEGQDIRDLADSALQWNRVQFQLTDAAAGSKGVDGTTADDEALPYAVADYGVHFSHIFAFSLVFSKVDLLNIAERLNTTDFKVLVWSENEAETKKLGVRNVVLIGTFSANYSGGSSMFYFYAKVLPQQKREVPVWEVTAQCSQCGKVMLLNELNAHELEQHGTPQPPVEEEVMQEQEVPPTQERGNRVQALLMERALRLQQKQQEEEPVVDEVAPEEEQKQQPPPQPINVLQEIEEEEEKEPQAVRQARERAVYERQLKEEEEEKQQRLVLLQPCPICRKTGFSSQHELDVHASSHFDQDAQQMSDQSDEVRIPCDVCPTAIPFSQYGNHMQIHEVARQQRQQQQQYATGFSISEIYDLQERQRTAVANNPPPLLSWNDRNAFSNAPFADTNQFQAGHARGVQFPPSYQPGRVSFTKLNGVPILSQAQEVRMRQEEARLASRRGLALRDILQRAFDFSKMSDCPFSLSDKVNLLRKSDLTELPLANLDNTDLETEQQGLDHPPCCFVCFVPYSVGDTVMVTRCGHYAHTNCLTEWFLKQSYLCPYCKHPQTQASLLDYTVKKRQQLKDEAAIQKKIEAEQAAALKKLKEEAEAKRKQEEAQRRKQIEEEEAADLPRQLREQANQRTMDRITQELRNETPPKRRQQQKKRDKKREDKKKK